MFATAWDAELIESNPVDRAKVPRMREGNKRQRMILTDDEFVRFMASDRADLQIKLMSLVSRTLGGMRTGDVIAWDWSMIDRAHFAECFIPREKTKTPDRLEVPAMVRPFLHAKWQAMGEPESGPVFPVERGQRAGEARKPRAQSFAGRLRRNLLAAGIVRMPPVEVRKTIKVGQKRTPREVVQLAPNPRDPLYNDTTTTLRVDFHSFRRAFSTALAEADVNVQQACSSRNRMNPARRALLGPARAPDRRAAGRNPACDPLRRRTWAWPRPMARSPDRSRPLSRAYMSGAGGSTTS